MEMLMSNWCDFVQSVPESYVFPPHRRPGKHDFPVCKDIPLIDLGKAKGHKRQETIQQILNACQEWGIFKVINHGVPEKLMDDTMKVMSEFFETPAEYKAGFYSNEMSKSVRIYSSTMHYDKEEFHYWRDNFTHHCHPLEDYIHLWPKKPAGYREVVGAYAVEVRKSLLGILDLIREGLAIEAGHFDGELSGIQLFSVNHHIPCPDPSLTLAVPEHCDINLITMLHQGSVPGLQMLINGQWMGVEFVPNAFVIFPGIILKVISNGGFKSSRHRVVTHSKEVRTTIGTFLVPSYDYLIEPATPTEVAVYRGFTYNEYLDVLSRNQFEAEIALEYLKNKPDGGI